jgi:hypothetical protein
MANPSKHDLAARKVLAVARTIVTYQIGLPMGCKRMERTLSALGVYETDLPTVFAEYLRAVHSLPIGAERLHWDREVLRRKDVELEATNEKFRDLIFDACWSIIDRFADREGPA